MAAWVSQSGDACLVEIWIQPRASRDRVVGLHEGALKVQVTAPPVEGEANKALVEFLAKRLGVPKSRLEIVAGKTGRHKRLRIEGVCARDAEEALLREGEKRK